MNFVKTGAITLCVLSASFGAHAQTTPPSPPPSGQPGITAQPAPTPGQTNTQMPTTPSVGSTMGMNNPMTLTDDQARSWVDKVVYSSDNQNLGEVAAFARDSSGKVTEMHADIGGLMGLGETRVRLMPSQFRLDNDRVVVNLTAEQVKALPAIPKSQ
jgi:hypothetical protein